MTEPPIPSGWLRERLGDCCTIVSGGTPARDRPEYWNGTIPWVTPKDISNIDDPIFCEPPERITELGLKNSSATLLPRGAILFSSRAPIGLVAIVGAQMATNQGFKSLIPSARLDTKFLYYTMKRMAPIIAAKGRGATFKEVSKSVMEDIEIVYPKDINVQTRVAAMLDKADAVRHRRRQALAEIDTLLRAQLLALYAKYPNDLNEITLADTAINEKNSFCNGPFGSDLLTSELISTGVPVIYIRDIRDGRYERVSEACVTSDKAEKLRACRVIGGDILIAKVGDPPGTAAIYPSSEPPAIVTQDVIRLRTNPEIVAPEFLWCFLNSGMGRHAIAGITVEATRARFSLGDLKKLEIRLPRRDLQDPFVAFANAHLSLRQSLQQVAMESDSLFYSLSQHAFQGEL